MSKFGQFCDRFIEVGWLVAIGLVPLYINFFSVRGHSVGKAYLLRVVVLLVAGAWIVRLVEDGHDRGLRNALAPLWRNPLAVPVLAYLLVLLLTAATSVAPSLSFRGSFGWLQGASTTLVYIAFFCLIVLNLRTKEQFDRIISVLLLASVPIALYGVAQELGWDPLSHFGPRRTIRWRARSTLGNHIFLGAYLIMVMPWTAARLIDAAKEWREKNSTGASRMSTAFLGAGSILIQNLALAVFLVLGSAKWQIWWATLPVLTGYLFLVLWTTSLRPKAPPLVMVSGYACLLMLQTVALVFTQARGPWLGALVAAGLLGLLIALRWGMRRLLAGVAASVVLVSLLVAVLNLRQGPLEPVKRYALVGRLGSLSDFETSSAKFRLRIWGAVGRLLWYRPNIGLGPDSLAVMRPIIGYGPESLSLAVERTLHPALGKEEGWQTDHGQAHNDFMQHLAENGLLGLVAFVFLLFVFYRATLTALWESQDRGHQLSLIALIAAMSAHIIELQFGVAVTATRMLFWGFLALGAFLAQPLAAILSEGVGEHRSPWRSWVFPYLLLTLLVVFAVSSWVKVQAVWTGFFVAFGGLVFGMVFLSLNFGPLSGSEIFRRGKLWLHALILGVVGLLIYYGAFRPLVAQAYFRFGTVADIREKPLLSVLAYQRTVALEPRNDVYHAGLGRALMDLGLLLWREKPNAKPAQGFQATPMLSRTIGPEPLVELGGEGALALAEASLQEARRLQPLSPRYLFYLAQLNHYWGLSGRADRFDLALRYYEEAARMSPNRLPTLLEWAMVHLAKNQPTQALERIQAAQSLGHDSWLVHYALSLVYDKMGKRDLALSEAEIAASDSPKGDGRAVQLLEGLRRDQKSFPQEMKSSGRR